MNEVLNTVPATAVTVVGHLVTFGLGWAGALWYRRNPRKAAAIKAVAADGAAAVEAFAQSVGAKTEEEAARVRTRLEKAGFILNEKAK